jgi:hypothetical protein
MIPKEQRIEFYWDRDENDNTLKKECQSWIKKGYIIHQIIPFKSTKSFYLLLYKY